MQNFRFRMLSGLLLLLPLLLGSNGMAEEKKVNKKDVCAQAHPEQLCNSGNTCGSATNPCTVDVKRTANSTAATADVTTPKGNALFCVAPGTTVTWRTTAKNTGFVVDFPSSPFDTPGAIIGGSDRSVNTEAKQAGCYNYTAGACVSGVIQGMCRDSSATMIVTGSK